jgi:hypothetical protein
LQILLALKQVITADQLFDSGNPNIVLCDEALETAIDMKALHVSEIRCLSYQNLQISVYKYL